MKAPLLSTVFYCLALLPMISGFMAFLPAQRLVAGSHNTIQPLYSTGGPQSLGDDQAAAAAMGLTMDQYKAVVKAQESFTQMLDDRRVQVGSPDQVSIERDLNGLPKHISINISEAAKAKGSISVSAELITLLNEASQKVQANRAAAHKEVMESVNKVLK